MIMALQMAYLFCRIATETSKETKKNLPEMREKWATDQRKQNKDAAKQ